MLIAYNAMKDALQRCRDRLHWISDAALLPAIRTLVESGSLRSLTAWEEKHGIKPRR
jgi:hypothetical protein